MDIVNRLRDTMHTGGALIGPEAADEIERLTADRDRWRSLAERAMDLLDEANRVLAQIQDGLKND